MHCPHPNCQLITKSPRITVGFAGLAATLEPDGPGRRRMHSFKIHAKQFCMRSRNVLLHSMAFTWLNYIPWVSLHILLNSLAFTCWALSRPPECMKHAQQGFCMNFLNTFCCTLCPLLAGTLGMAQTARMHDTCSAGVQDAFLQDSCKTILHEILQHSAALHGFYIPSTYCWIP